MSAPENPRWLNEIGDELRREVPVRAAWRSQLLDDIARLPVPTAEDEIDDGDRDSPRRSASRRIVLTPFTSLAAAVVFCALGASAMYVALASRAPSGRDTIASRSRTDPSSTASWSATAQELVRFQLSAPNASHVALVGSFNEWNPVATPLTRDPATGTWVVSLRLPPGRHVYAFVVDGDVTADPAAPRAADNDFGSANSVVLVSGRTS